MSNIPGNTSSNVTISQGQVINGSLDYDGDADWYKATFSSGLDYGFRLSGDGSGSTLPDPDLYLYDANGNYLEGSTNYSLTSVTVNFSATNAGTYFVGVKDNGSDTGNYILTWLGDDTIRRDVNTTAAIAQGQTVTGAVDVAGDSDWFKISLKAGLDYGFVVSGDGSASSLPDADLRLRDANGNLLAGDANYSSDSYSIAYAASQTGVYFLDVRDNGSDTGNYKLSWTGADTILRNTSTTEVLGTGKSITSAIDVKNDSDWFKVSLKAGISYAFTVTGTGSNGLPDGDIVVRDANGTFIKGETNYSSPTGIVAFTPTTSGTYFIEVDDNSNDMGKYVVSNPSLDTVFNNTSTTHGLLVGRSLKGNIDVEADSDWYSFNAEAGVTYKFTASGTGSAPANGLRLALRDADGNVISADSDKSAVVEFKATGSGKFYLDVSGSSSSVTGGFILSAVSDQPVLKGTSSADTILGGDNDTKMYGYGGNDILDGAGGNDVIDGGSGADTMRGGAGNDIYYVDNVGDKVIEAAGQGVDLIRTSVSFSIAGTYVERVTLTGSADIDGTGNGLANTIVGNTGDNVIDGKAGADILYGGKGNDVYYVDNVSDQTIEYAGQGTDTVRSSISWTLDDNVEQLRLLGTSDINGVGNALNNLIVGNSGDNRLNGGAGADSLNGGDGLDTASYAGATSAVGASLWNPASNTGDAKGDTYSSIERLVGSSFSDRLEGNSVGNRLYGGDGNDRLYGGSGADKLYGGAGGDHFIFKKASESTMSVRDMIYDFSHSQGDKLHLSAIDANINLSGDQAFSFIGKSAFSDTAGELRYAHANGDTYVYGDVNGDGQTDFSVRLDGTITLNNSDFFL